MKEMRFYKVNVCKLGKEIHKDLLPNGFFPLRVCKEKSNKCMRALQVQVKQLRFFKV